MKREIDEVQFESTVRFKTLPVKGLDKFIPTDTTPSVKNLETWIANNTGAITVTDFDDAANEQRIKILGDGFTTIANNANIKTNTGANKLLAVNKIYVFTNINGIWYEDA